MRKKELIMRLGAAEEQIEALEERIARVEGKFAHPASYAEKPKKSAAVLYSEWWNGEAKK